MQLGILMKDFKVSIHSLLCSDGSGSFLLDSVSLKNTTRSAYTPLSLMVRDPAFLIQYIYGRLQGQYTLSLVLPTWLSIFREHYKVSIHFHLCSDCPVSFLLDSVSLRNTTGSVYTLSGAMMVQNPSYVTLFHFGRLQGQYTLFLVLWWSRILSMWLSIVMEDFNVSIPSSWCFEGPGSFL